MAYIPSATPRVEPKKDNNKTWILILLVLLICSWGYFIYSNNQKDNTIKAKEIQYVTIDGERKAITTARDSIKAAFDIIAVRADSLQIGNVKLEGALAERSAAIQKLKSNIGTILKKKNATDAELKEAKDMVAQLNGKVEEMFVEITKLKGENQQLTNDKNQLSSDKEKLETNLAATEGEKKNLESKVDVASTLHASNINITAMKGSGGKEKETETAKKASFFRVNFQLDENRITPTGKTAIYVAIYAPDGKPSVSEGTIKTRDGQDVSYTSKVDVNYEQGKITPVSFDWKPGEQFVTGDYKIEIYNNGFKIGEGRKSLKKGGFLGL